MTEDICGEPTVDDEPCGRPSGWGTDSSIGPCKDHAEEYQVPDKLDEETIQTLCGAARSGAKLKDCARVAQISPVTLRRWRSQGQDHAEAEIDTPLRDFYERFQRARGAGAVELLQDASSEFILQTSYDYTKTEKREVDMDADMDHSFDATEGVTAEFVTYEPEDDGDD